MSYVALEQLLKPETSLYKLVLLAAKRALEISQGAPPLVEVHGKVPPPTIALQEIREAKVSYKLTAEGKQSGKKHA